jgi:RHS repeat-associated protein
VCLGLSARALAQNENETTGFSSTHIFDGGYFGENIDTLNGNLTLTVPIGPKFQVNRALDYQLNLVYNSRVWQFEDTSSLAVRSSLMGQSGMGLGFSLSFGRLYRDFYTPISGGLEERWYFVSSDGNKHDMGTLADPGPSNDSTYYVPQVNRDGNNNITSIIITDGSGRRYTLGRQVVIPDVSSIPGMGGKCHMCDWNDANAAFGGWYVTRIEDITTVDASGGYPNWVAIQYEIPSGPTPQESPEGYGQSIDQITDSLGRTIEFDPPTDLSTEATGTPGHPGDPRARRVARIHVPSFDNNPALTSKTATYTFGHDYVSVSVPDASSEVKRSVLRLKSIELPGHTPAYKISFSYDGSELVMRTLPMNETGDSAGARMEYDYQKYDYLRRTIQSAGANSSGKIQMGGALGSSGMTRQIVQKSLYLGAASQSPSATWDYIRSTPAGVTNPDLVTVRVTKSNPLLFNDTVYYFHASHNLDGCENAPGCDKPDDGWAPEWNDGLNYRIDYWEGEALVGRLLRKEETTYTTDILSSRFTKNNLRTTGTVTTRSDDGGKQFSTQNAEWDTVTHHWKVTTESAFGMPAPRVTRTEYIPHGSRTDTFDYQEVSGGGVVYKRSDYLYDSGGRLIRERNRKTPPSSPASAVNLVPETGDVVTDYAYNVAGNVDTKTISTPGLADYRIEYRYNLNNVGPSLQTKQFLGMSWKSIDWRRDGNTGLIYQTCDSALVCTNYNYDELGRITRIIPTYPEYPTIIQYTTLKTTEVSQSSQTSTLCGPSEDCINAKYLYDDLGHLVETKKRSFDGTFVHQMTSYDALSNVTFRSEWGIDGTTPAGTAYDYRDPATSPNPNNRQEDPFGRPFVVTTADGKTTRTTYRGLSSTVTVEGISGKDGASLNSTTTYARDELERLIEVSSPIVVDANSGATIPTQAARALYSYDGLDQLTQVDLVAADGTHQIRTFAYDALGRLLREDNPENGTTTYGSYDALGNLHSKTDNAGTTFSMTYDLAGRLRETSQGVTGQAAILIARNTYDLPTSGADTFGYSQGKLTKVESFTDLGNPEVTEKYYFNGLNGRPSGDVTAFPEIANDYKTSTWYNNFGLPNSLQYPLDGTQRPRRNLIRVYANGFLRSITDLQDAGEIPVVYDVAYNPAGGISEIRTGVDFRDVISYDARNRPTRIQVQRINNSTLNPIAWYWDTGLYLYDGAGNIKEIGASPGNPKGTHLTFSHDGVNRLVGAAIEKQAEENAPPQSVYLQADYTLVFDYDSFGNMVKRDDTFWGTHRGFAVNAQTNRVSSVTSGAVTTNLAYDSNGSIVQDELHTFVNDKLNRVVQVREGSLEVDRFRYDAAGRRVVKKSENSGLTTYYVRDREGQVLSEFSRPTSSTALPLWKGDYVYLGGRVVAMTERDKPDPPAGLYVKTWDGAHAGLGWQRSAESDVTGYDVYRGSTLITTVTDPGATTFTDNVGACGTYNYRLKAKDPLNTSDFSPDYVVNLCDQTIPNPPTGLTATAGDGQVSLTWTAPTPAGTNPVVGYEIFRGIPSGQSCPGAQFNTVPMTGTTFVDAPLANGSARCYYVKAWNAAAKESAASNTVTATPSDHDAPAMPRNLRAHTGCAGGKVSLAWDANTEPDLDHYELIRSQSSSMSSPTVQTYAKNTLLPVTDDPLGGAAPAGQTFYYALEAWDVAGNHTRGPVLQVQLRYATQSAPTNLVASGGSSHVTLDWNVSSVATRFRVYRRPAGGSCADLQIILDQTLSGGPHFSTQDQIATNFKGYEYAVSAVSSSSQESYDSSEIAGPAYPVEGPESTRACYTPWPGVLIGLPPDGPYMDTLVLSWPHVSLAQELYDPAEAAQQGRGYIRFLGYTRMQPSDFIFNREFVDWQNQLEATIFGPWYSVKWRAVYKANDWKYCESLKPAGSSAVCTGKTPTLFDQDGHCIESASYDPCDCLNRDVCVFVGERKVPPSQAGSFNPVNHPSYVFSDPPKEFGVTTIANYFRRDYHACTAVMPPKPTNVEGSTTGVPGEIRLQWSPPPGNVQVAGYQIIRGSLNAKPISLPANATSYTFAGQDLCKGMSVHVESVDGFGVSSRDMRALPKMVEPQPLPPGEIHLNPGPASEQITLSWQRPALSGCKMTHVKIIRTGAGSSTILTSTAGESPLRESWTDTGLVPGQTYTYTLQSTLSYIQSDQWGNMSLVESDYSSPSAPVSGTALGTGGIGMVLPPTNVTASASTQSVLVGWTAPTTGAPPIGYRIYFWTSQNPTPVLWNSGDLVQGPNSSVGPLTLGRTYSFAVSAVNWQDPENKRDVNGVPQYFESSHTAPISVLLPAAATDLVAPTAVTAFPGISEGQIQLHWNRSPSPAIGYYVEETTYGEPQRMVFTDASGNVSQRIDSTDPTITVTLSSLQRHYAHLFQVIAADDAEHLSQPSEAVSSFALDTAPPDPQPYCVFCSEDAPTTVTVRWYPASGHHMLIRREVQSGSGCGEDPKEFSNIPVAQTTLTDSVTAGCRYTYRIWAVDADGSRSAGSAYADVTYNLQCSRTCNPSLGDGQGTVTGAPCTSNCHGNVREPMIGMNVVPGAEKDPALRCEGARDQLSRGELEREETKLRHPNPMEPYRMVGMPGGGGGGGYVPPSFHWRFFHADHLGTPRLVTDFAGVISEHHYLPFGEEVPPSTHNNVTNSSNNSHRFTGHERDSESGLDYMMARYYSSSLGRFMAVDPGNDTDPENPQSWNKYSYVRNNPILLNDPTGEYVGVDDAAFAAGGAIVGILSQGVSDIMSGELSGWEDYTSSALGGALAGWSSEYVGPIAGGAAGAALGNAVGQGLKNLSGKQEGFDFKSLAEETAVGGFAGKIPELNVPGITAGVGSFKSVAKQVTTKLEKGTISSITGKTAAKMGTAAVVKDAARGLAVGAGKPAGTPRSQSSGGGTSNRSNSSHPSGRSRPAGGRHTTNMCVGGTC